MRRERRTDDARRVADVLRRVVTDSAPGRLLPAEDQLAAEYGVSRNAVRAALDLLRAEGLVERIQGTGTRVTRAVLPHGIDALRGLAETFRGHGEVRNEVRLAGLVAALGARGDAAGGRHRERRPLPRAAPARRRRAGLARPDLRGPGPRRAAARLRPGRTRRLRAAGAARRAAARRGRARDRGHRRRPLGFRSSSGWPRARRCCWSSGSPGSTTVVPSTSSTSGSGATGSPSAAPRAGCRPTSPEHEETP